MRFNEGSASLLTEVRQGILEQLHRRRFNEGSASLLTEASLRSCPGCVPIGFNEGSASLLTEVGPATLAEAAKVQASMKGQHLY